jgi:hypothetical protein
MKVALEADFGRGDSCEAPGVPTRAAVPTGAVTASSASVRTSNSPIYWYHAITEAEIASTWSSNPTARRCCGRQPDNARAGPPTTAREPRAAILLLLLLIDRCPVDAACPVHSGQIEFSHGQHFQ